MKNLIKLLTLVSISLIPQTSITQCHIDDWTALKALYESTDGDNWSNRVGWDELIGNQNSPPTICNLRDLNWVELDGNGRVYRLWPTGNRLYGNIPPELGNLSELRDLILSDNYLFGNIPLELGNLSKLKNLNLENNLLINGSIPQELGNLSNLQILNLSRNQLNNSVPSQLGNLSGLVSLDLGQNQLNSDIPSQFANLSNLEELNLSGNELTGIIPPILGNLTNLLYLNLSFNQLSGSIPSQLGNLTNLEQLWLSNNQLSGNLPPEFGNLIYLMGFGVSDNQLSGCYDVNLLNLAVGDNRNVSYGNSFNASWESFRYNLDGTGACSPPNYENIHTNNLNALIALYNSANGTNWRYSWDLNQPAYLWSGVSLDGFGNVVRLSLWSNQLYGSIPSEIGSLGKLVILNLSNNQLNGSIPIELGNLNNLLELRLDSNELNGHVPSELGNLPKLERLDLSDNHLNGNIPSEISNLNNLQELRLYNNQLNGSLPVLLDNLTNLEWLSLHNNQISGSVPVELGNLTNLRYLSLSDNKFNNSIPTQLGYLTSLYSLDLSRNEFSGSIPAELGNLTNLKFLRLDSNQLSGSLPNQLHNLNYLEWIWLDNNQLSGCYNEDLNTLCERLIFSDISNGNSFDATWEDFCATGAGTCDECIQDCESNVYPGDINNDGIVNNQDDAIHYLYYNYNNNNIPRQEQGINWQAYSCADWGFPVPECYLNDIKHFDCNGDGAINIADKNAIITNWGNTHNESNIPGAGIYSFSNYPSDYKIYLQPVGNINNNLLIMNIALEHINREPLILFGGFFTVHYNDANANILNAVADFNISWLGIPKGNLNMDFKDFPQQKKIEVAFSRTDGTNATGSGVIGQIAFTLDNSNLRQSGNTQILQFEAINVGAHNNVGSPIAISNQYLPVNVGNVNCESSITIDQSTPFQNHYRSSGTIQTSDDLIIGQNQQVEYHANRIKLNIGFRVREGADFKVRYDNCN